MRYPYFSVGQSLGAKITQKQALVKLGEENELGNLSPPTLAPSVKPDFDSVQKQKMVFDDQSRKESIKPDLSLSKENSEIKVSAIPGDKVASKKDLQQNSELTFQHADDDSLKKIFDFSMSKSKADDGGEKAVRRHRHSDVCEKKPTQLSSFKNLLDDEDIESLLGKMSPSKSRLPQGRSKPVKRETKDSGFGYHPRFSPEKRFNILPSITSAAIKPRRDSAGLSKLAQQPFGRNAKMNSNNNANDRGHVEPLRKAGRSDSFWSNLFSEDTKAKADVAPRVRGVEINDSTNTLKYEVLYFNVC